MNREGYRQAQRALESAARARYADELRSYRVEMAQRALESAARARRELEEELAGLRAKTADAERALQDARDEEIEAADWLLDSELNLTPYDGEEGEGI